jgi:internalin A
MLRLEGNPITDPATLTPLFTGLTSIQDFRIENVPIGDLTAIGQMKTLKLLDIQYDSVTDLTPLANLTQLSSLFLGGNAGLTDLSPILALPITDLTVSSTGLTDLSALSSFSGLTALEASHLTFNSNTETLALIGGMTQLERLVLESDGLTSISALGGLTNLTLFFVGANSLTSVSAMQVMDQLQAVDISYNQITTLAPFPSNAGIGAGDSINAVMNPQLDCSANAVYIDALRSAGVSLTVDCP